MAIFAATAVFSGGAISVSADEGPSGCSKPPAGPYSSGDSLSVNVIPLAAKGAVPNSDQKPSTYVVIYPGKEVVVKICNEQGTSEDAARELLKSLLTHAENRPDNILWTVDGQLVIEASAAGHKQVAARLESIRKSGLPQIAIETRFVAVDGDELLKTALPDSTIAPLDTSEAKPAEVIDVPPAGLDRPLGSHEGTRVVRAHMVVEKALPLRFRVLDKDESKKWLTACLNDRRTNLLQAPKVTVFSGQTGIISDTSRTPFVVGLKKLDGDAQQPQIRIVTEGTTLQLRPTAGASGVVHLDFLGAFSKIQEVETVTFPLTAAGGGTIQVPEVATSRMEGGADLQPGQCLLLCGWQDQAVERVVGEPEPSWMDWLNGEKHFKARPRQALVLMLRAEIIQSPHTANHEVSLLRK